VVQAQNRSILYGAVHDPWPSLFKISQGTLNHSLKNYGFLWVVISSFVRMNT